MHDVNGAALKVGDRVLVECEVTMVSADQDYCNVTVQTVHGMPGNGLKTSMTVNTRQVGVSFKKDAS
jgi:hypothetical protein